MERVLAQATRCCDADQAHRLNDRRGGWEEGQSEVLKASPVLPVGALLGRRKGRALPWLMGFPGEGRLVCSLTVCHVSVDNGDREQPEGEQRERHSGEFLPVSVVPCHAQLRLHAALRTPTMPRR